MSCWIDHVDVIGQHKFIEDCHQYCLFERRHHNGQRRMSLSNVLRSLTIDWFAFLTSLIDLGGGFLNFGIFRVCLWYKARHIVCALRLSVYINATMMQLALSVLALIGCISNRNYSATALAPPHPDWTDFETVHEMRRRMGIQFDYEPEHLSHQHCRHMSEEECQAEDEGLADAKAGRNGRHLSPSTGQALRILVLLIRFPNHKDRVLPSQEYFEELFNGSQSDVNPIGSIKEYLRFSSLGMYRVQVRSLF